MEMRGGNNIDIGEDVTPPLPPLAFSLFDSHLSTHCSSCSSPLSAPNPNPNTPLYCSSKCSATSSPLHHASAAHHLSLLPTLPDSSSLRAALFLLLRFHSLHIPLSGPRIAGLLTNRNSNDLIIRDGAKAMAMARGMRDGVEFCGDAEEEEAVLWLVVTNAVEVVQGGGAVGIAVYGTEFSWINHSCVPNACYRFLLSSETETQRCCGESRLRIVPGGDEIEQDVLSGSELETGWYDCGPRIVVRSIKKIKEGEAVSIAYIDLLQPKEMRQSELWSKYQFMCSCRRCSASPPNYADHALQETSAVPLDFTDQVPNLNFVKDQMIENFTDHINDIISEFLSDGNSTYCCAKLENLLTHGFPDEQSNTIIRLHPKHHLCLNAYTTLASAYNISANLLLGPSPESDRHKRDEAFHMRRIGAAYSILLACATHHLFLTETSLIASLTNFWMSAGESLLTLTRSPSWDPFVKPMSSSSSKCCNCSLMGYLDGKLSSNHARNTNFEDISREFCDCITSVVPKVWNFLIEGCDYLKSIKDPIDFRWHTKERFSRKREWGYTNQVRIDLFQLGVHCLLYGRYLSSICYGCTYSSLAPDFHILVSGEDDLIS